MKAGRKGGREGEREEGREEGREGGRGGGKKSYNVPAWMYYLISYPALRCQGL